MQKDDFKTVDEYIQQFPSDIQELLIKIRESIRSVATEAEETINYQIPTFKIKGKNLVHFAAFEKHIGFYPSPSGITAFKNELSKYKTSKGTVQFPLKDELPLQLIMEMVQFRLQEMNK
jgi:uncharacterized protein YdhG (YjbR/CyaY superfamily)